MTDSGLHDLALQIRSGDRRALARAITLVESRRPDDASDAESLLTGLLPRTGNACRLGISGAPGAGKSSFIEVFGKHLTGLGHKVAVLAIDPSSQRSGGSILGDKTRMANLSRDPAAFIRASPAGTTLGGVARRTREAMLLTEAAGFDVVIIETVGVGQSETAVSEMVDVFVLLANPGGGDELQGIKRGAMELADLVLVTKADGDLAAAARRAVADYRMALHLLRPKYPSIAPDVLAVSSHEGVAIAEAWTAIEALHSRLSQEGHLQQLRQEQARGWFWSEVRSALTEKILHDPRSAEAARRIEEDVLASRVLPHAAARNLVEAFLHS
ncbi:MAG: methylmalonyl Co-A mutase-associated GTPase MeaB [Rhizomicrobium sp.]